MQPMRLCLHPGHRIGRVDRSLADRAAPSMETAHRVIRLLVEDDTLELEPPSVAALTLEPA